MSKKVLGIPGQCITWLSYALLLYAALCAYSAAGGDFLQVLLSQFYLSWSPTFNSLLFILFFGSITWLEVHWIDYTNRGLMLLKFALLFVLIISIFPYITHVHYLPVEKKHLLHDLPGSIMVVVLSFTFSVILPAMRVYLKSSITQLKWSILIGSIIPLFLYIIWIYTALLHK